MTPQNRRLRAAVMTILLILPVLAMFLIWRDARSVPLGVLGGGLFRAPWHIVHAGFSMDQPTIGKWYFWSTIFSSTWIAFAGLACRVCKPCARSIGKAYTILMLCILFLYLLVHTVPFYWTLQYISNMGLTPRRLIALAWGITGYVTLLTLSALLIRGVRRAAKKG